MRETLELGHNHLKYVPAKVLELTHLETLDLCNNNLRTLPREMGQLTRLCTLKLDNNNLEKLPKLDNNNLEKFTALLSNPTLDCPDCKGSKRLSYPPGDRQPRWKGCGAIRLVVIGKSQPTKNRNLSWLISNLSRLNKKKYLSTP